MRTFWFRLKLHPIIQFVIQHELIRWMPCSNRFSFIIFSIFVLLLADSIHLRCGYRILLLLWWSKIKNKKKSQSFRLFIISLLSKNNVSTEKQEKQINWPNQEQNATHTHTCPKNECIARNYDVIESDIHLSTISTRIQREQFHRIKWFHFLVLSLFFCSLSIFFCFGFVAD